MQDITGRTIDYMRISITDRCNLRCRYCMPDGVECVPMADILTFEEIHRVAAAAAGLGIRHIKVTGGEPLVRKGCCSLIKMLKETPGIEKVTITTNGILLDQYLDELMEAGIDGINISLDTLDARLYRELTGGGHIGKVLDSIRRASALSVPVKINAVSLDLKDFAAKRNITIADDGDWKGVLKLARQYPVDVRFIEMMPIGYGRDFQTINHQELIEEIRRMYPAMTEDHRIHGFGPAVYYQIPGFLGSLGLISAIHGKFCSDCNRVRLTAMGHLKPCLCYESGADLRPVLRCSDSADIAEARLQDMIRETVFHKPNAHCFDQPEAITERHNMVAIGG